MDINEPCNIWKQQCKIPISRGQVLCPKCNGRGGHFLNASFKTKKFEIRSCDLCKGEGKVDWITAITKKAENKGYLYLHEDIKEIHIKCSGPKRCKKKLKRFWLERKRFIDPYGPCAY